jgi:arylsulfatase A-like enzyme
MPEALTNRADFEKLINGYDGGIAYWDFHLGRLLETLRELGIGDDVAIVVTADHGVGIRQ